MKTLAVITANAIGNLPPGSPALAVLQSNQLAFLTNFAAQMSTLQSISEKELAQQPLNLVILNRL